MRERVVVLVKVPDVPVMITVNVPVVAVPLVEKVNALLEVAGFVANVPPTPLGKPDALSMTLP